MKYFRLKNWRDHQHYKDRNPPWIKLYVSILDPESSWSKLDDRRRGMLANLLAWASRMDNVMPADNDLIRQEIGATSPFDLSDFSDFILLYDNRVECLASENASKNASKNACFREQSTEYRVQSTKKKKEPCPAGAAGRVAGEARQPRPDPYEQDTTEVLDYLNIRRAEIVPNARGFDAKSKGNRRLPRARLASGHPKADLLAVIDSQLEAWRDNAAMHVHFCPDTLFNETKFNKYLANIGVDGDGEAAQIRAFLEAKD